jgi:ceramide glucosyltransferase
MTAAELAGLLCLVLIGANLLSLAVAAWRLEPPRPPRPVPAKAPPVSIVRPVCGLEPYSEATLRSGFALDYPDYELVFCVAEERDPIVPLVRRLMAEHPERPARLLVGDDRISGNPKLNNCVKGWDAARHDWVILADCNVLMPRDYVQRLMERWQPNTGLVCSTPAGSRPKGFFAEVECAFLNSLQARWQYVGEALGFGFAQGKSMLWHKPLLEAWGGIRALAAEIAEDAAATKLVRAAGLTVHLAGAPFEQPLGPRQLKAVWSRQIRWARLRRVTFPLFFAPELFSSSLPALVLAGIGAPAVGLDPLAGILLAAVAWYGPEAALTYRLGWHISWRFPAAAVLRDLIVLPMWACAWLSGQVVWRGNAMSIGIGKTGAEVLRPSRELELEVAEPVQRGTER